MFIGKKLPAGFAICMIVTGGSLGFPSSGISQMRIEPIYQLGVLEGPEEEIFGPHVSSALGQSGELYLGDWSSGEIRVFSPDGALVRRFGNSGEGPGEFRQTTSLAIGANDSLYVFDAFLHRVTVFDSSGAAVRDFRIPFGAPSSLRMTRHPGGMLVFVGSIPDDPSLVHWVTPEGEHMRSSGRLLPQSSSRGDADPAFLRAQLNQGVVTVTPDGDVIAALAAPYRIARLSPSGEVRWVVEDPVLPDPLDFMTVTAERYSVGLYPRVTAIHALDDHRFIVLHADFESEERHLDLRRSSDGRLIARREIPYSRHVSRVHPLEADMTRAHALVTETDLITRYTVAWWSPAW